MASLELDRIRSIVVTGGAGFLGSHIVDDLLAHCPNARVRVIDNLTYAASTSHLDAAFRTGRLALQEGDVRNLDLMTTALRDADLVIHAAGESHVDRAHQVPERATLANALGTQVVADAAGRARVPLMIHVSSAEVYGAGDRTPLAETAPMKPDNPLGASKAAAEMLIAGLGGPTDIDIRILRPVNVVGIRQNAEKLLPRFLELASVGRPLPVHGEGMQMRAFVTIADVCAGLRAIITRGEPNGIYNIDGNDRHDILSIARMVLDEIREPVSGIAFTAGRPVNPTRPALDTTRLRALGWQPAETLAGVLPGLAAWYAARLPAGQRAALRSVPDFAARDARVVTQPAGSGLFRSLERH